MVTKSELHELVDQLTANGVIAAERYLRRLRDDPFLAMLEAAPEDDEPLTGDIAAIEQGRRDYAAGNYVTLEQLERESPTTACPEG